jgi:hypothetical protein
VFNATREVELYTPDDQKIGTRYANMIAYYSDWSDRNTPTNTIVQRVSLTITPRCVITKYLPKLEIAKDVRY